MLINVNKNYYFLNKKKDTTTISKKGVKLIALYPYNPLIKREGHHHHRYLKQQVM